jgi:hypothetical protein
MPKKPQGVRYGLPHRAMRARFAPLVAAGKAKCARCGEAIEPGSDWALDHRDDGRGYLGVSHSVCNSRAGAFKLLGLNGHGGALVEKPYRWSQRWFDDPPVGTTVVLGDGLVEVHVGGGVWETRKAVGES